MKKYSNKTVIESLGLPMLTCFDDLVKELSLSGKYSGSVVKTKI